MLSRSTYATTGGSNFCRRTYMKCLLQANSQRLHSVKSELLKRRLIPLGTKKRLMKVLALARHTYSDYGSFFFSRFYSEPTRCTREHGNLLRLKNTLMTHYGLWYLLHGRAHRQGKSSVTGGVAIQLEENTFIFETLQISPEYQWSRGTTVQIAPEYKWGSGQPPLEALTAKWRGFGMSGNRIV